MRLSVIIVNYRSWESLGLTLEALADGARDEESFFEVLVVDNDSGDGHLEEYRARFPQVSFYLAPGNHGFAHACNVGAARAGGELLLFLNPDVRATPEDLQTLVAEKRAHSGCAIMTACQHDDRGRPRKVCDMFPGPLTSFPALRALLRLLRPARYPGNRPGVGSSRAPIPCDWVSGSVLMVSRHDLQRLGGWNERFWLYYEDVDLCLRAKRLGMAVACTTALGLRHDHGGASRRNETTSILTRTEVIISRHVYVQENFAGPYGWAFHTVLLLRETLGLGLCALADLMTLSQLSALRVRARVLKALVVHCGGAARRGSWQSPRAAASLSP